MGTINSVFNRTGWSILALANATAKYRAQRNEEGKNRAKQSYSTIATIKKQNNELTQNKVEAPKSYFSDNLNIPPEIDEQKIAEQTVLKEMTQERAKATSLSELAGVKEAPAPERAKATSFGELPTVSAENSETNISAKDPEVQGLIEVKQKNALRAVAGQRSQKRYQNIKAKLTSTFADYSYIDDVWREISLDPDVTDEMIKKAGFTKAQILEEWKWYKDSPTDWMRRQNLRGDEYGITGSEAEADDYDYSSFGRLLSAYIKAKVKGKTLAQQWEEHELSKAEEEPDELYESIGEAMEEHELKQAKNKKPSVDDWYLNFDRNNSTMSDSSNYKVWQDESTEEEKDENKKDKGIIF